MSAIRLKAYFKIFRPLTLGIVLVATLTFSAPTFSDEAHRDEAQSNDGDPLEALNRFTSGFNMLLRKTILDPAVNIYQFVTPDPLEKIISNAASNLSEPLTIGSSLLQGDTENAATSAQRFLINSTIGVAGLGDPATDMGLKQRREDLGQAMGVNGVAPGPHLVLPLLGPSNFRDATGDILSGILSPMPLAGTISSGMVGYADNQDTLNSISATAIDRYIAERESYEQNREYKVKNGDIILPAFDEDQPKK